MSAFNLIDEAGFCVQWLWYLLDGQPPCIHMYKCMSDDC